MLSCSTLKNRMLMFYPDIKSQNTRRNHEWAALHNQFFMLFSFPILSSPLCFFLFIFILHISNSSTEQEMLWWRAKLPPAHKTNIWFTDDQLCNCKHNSICIHQQTVFVIHLQNHCSSFSKSLSVRLLYKKEGQKTPLHLWLQALTQKNPLLKKFVS